jgi:MoxR-like ATPase
MTVAEEPVAGGAGNGTAADTGADTQPDSSPENGVAATEGTPGTMTSPVQGPGQGAVADADIGLLRQALAEVRRVIVGQEHMVERLLVALLAKGHCLLEGVPGVAKTLAASTLSTVVGGTFARVQFTPDLVPSDIVGTRVYHPSSESFDIELGPVFVNFLLADEINRAPAKVQSALLEVMAERQVTLAGRTHPLPRPFVVLATQNPIESEGVYPLPEVQRDRFLFRVRVQHPGAQEELEILHRMSVTPPRPAPVLTPGKLLALQAAADQVSVHQLVADYVVRLVMATRTPAEYGLRDLEDVIEIGTSPRATLGLVAAGRALALLRGRDYLLPDDVRDVAVDVMSHRLMLTFDALADGLDAEDVVRQILLAVPPPLVVWNQGHQGRR